MGDKEKEKQERYVDPRHAERMAKRKQKKEEADQKRLEKRKRVWVIDKEGKVKKVWKDGRDSPDSGLEVS